MSSNNPKVLRPRTSKQGSKALGQGGGQQRAESPHPPVPGPRRVLGGGVQPGGESQREEILAEQPVTWGEEGWKEEGVVLTSSGRWGGVEKMEVSRNVQGC